MLMVFRDSGNRAKGLNNKPNKSPLPVTAILYFRKLRTCDHATVTKSPREIVYYSTSAPRFET